MPYVAEFVGSLVFLLGGYAYMCNISLVDTLVGDLNYIELAVAWSLAVGFGLAVAVIMGGPAYLNPGAVLGNIIFSGLDPMEGLKYIGCEFLAAGTAIALCWIFFLHNFENTEDTDKRGIFSAYPTDYNLGLNFLQEVIATFAFLFLVLTTIKAASGTAAPIYIGVVGFAAVMLLSLTLNSTGFSMNAMRSFFSSIWFTILPIPNKGEGVDWTYQFVVNFIGSSIGGVLAVMAVSMF